MPARTVSMPLAPAREGAPSRREVLALAGAAAIAGSLPALPGHAAEPSVHRTPLGANELIVVSDGHLVVPGRNAAQGAPAAELEKALASGGQSQGESRSPVNVTLLKTPGGLVVFDVGAGPNFMPTAGKLAANLEAAGIDRKAVTKVLFTHGHPDHLWGAIDEFEDEPVFANAEHVVSAAEWNFWFSAGAEQGMPAGREAFVVGARRNLEKLKARIKTVKPGEEGAPGIRAVDTAGHTQGHISWEIAAGSESLIVLGDALTNPIISFQHPEWRPVADHEPDRAVATRKRLLDRLATDRVRFVGTHLPFPGLGRAERAGSAWRLVAA